MSLFQKQLLWTTLLCASFLIGCFTRWQMELALPFLGAIASISVLLAALPSFVQFLKTHRSPQGIIALLGLGVFALGIEILGVQTGFPYGVFAYHPTLHAQLVFGVPWTTPFGWLPLVFASHIVAQTITRKDQTVKPLLLALSILVGMDLVLDPGAVSLGLWRYAQGGLYYSIPLSNFFGWLLSGTLALFAVIKIHRQTSVKLMDRFYTLLGPASLLSFWVGFVAVAAQVIPTVIGIILIILFSIISLSKPSQSSRSAARKESNPPK